jgi:hypothetical protein
MKKKKKNGMHGLLLLDQELSLVDQLQPRFCRPLSPRLQSRLGRLNSSGRILSPLQWALQEISRLLTSGRRCFDRLSPWLNPKPGARVAARCYLPESV